MGRLHIELSITFLKLCRATSGRTGIGVGHLDNGSYELKSTQGLELKVIDTGPGLADSITPGHRPLSRETNSENETGFSSSTLRFALLLSTPEAESDQIGHDTNGSLQDLLFLRYA